MKNTNSPFMRSIHPFPARMAPEIAFRHLPTGKKLTVLDPMSGSGTTVVLARLAGHKAIGVDLDPLAVLLSKGWSMSFDGDELKSCSARVVRRAQKLYQSITASQAYPLHSDPETKKFIRYWFDLKSRKQLAALARCISRVRNPKLRTLLWCALSRLIITKQNGASLAMDVSHSRPHKVYVRSPINPLEKFENAVAAIEQRSPFKDNDKSPEATIHAGDARKLALPDNSIDLVITSPPYLTAIDYLRGHRLALVWLGHTICSLRKLRSNSVGAENGILSMRGSSRQDLEDFVARSTRKMQTRDQRIVRRYAYDMVEVISEINRVLKPGGSAVLVLGDCRIRGTFLKNSELAVFVSKRLGLELLTRSRRLIRADKRYLPPPSSLKAGTQLRNRLGFEVILQMRKPSAAIFSPRGM
jgi:SAM-dependent methyltransferase